jgi:hypothetical protein
MASKAASKSARTALAGAVLVLMSVAAPTVGSAGTMSDFLLDHSTLGTGKTTIGSVLVDQIASNELSVTVTMDKGYALLGVAFNTDDRVKLDPPDPKGWHLEDHGKLSHKSNEIYLPHAGWFGADLIHLTGKPGDTVTFDLVTKSSTDLSIVANNLGNFFAVQVIDVNKDGRFDPRFGLAWSNTDPPVGATPLPGALALFAPVVAAGYAFTRRRGGAAVPAGALA